MLRQIEQEKFEAVKNSAGWSSPVWAAKSPPSGDGLFSLTEITMVDLAKKFLNRVRQNLIDCALSFVALALVVFQLFR